MIQQIRITPQTSFEELPAMLTVQEVALWLNRDYKGLLDAIKAGKAPFSARKMGQQWRVSKNQFAEKKIEQIFKR
jgi:hypothetical protein